MLVESLLYDIGKKGSRPFDFHELLPHSFSLQHLYFCAQKTQHPTSSLLRLLREGILISC
jgi:hypothetical protein